MKLFLIAASLVASLDEPFRKAGVEGVTVVYDLRTGRTVTNDPVRAKTRFVPASTFKIMNSLIAFETGVAADENEFMKWDGVKRRVESWNRDMTLRDAMRVSAVWYYQEIARRIGAGRMQEWIDRTGYGNREIGSKIDQFWLEGPLRISPVEQIDFLVRLYRDELPFSKRSMKRVRDIVPAEGAIRGKTGWADSYDPDIGWYVGWMEADGTTYFFATNVDMPGGNRDAAKRIPITKEVLRLVSGQ